MYLLLRSIVLFEDKSRPAGGRLMQEVAYKYAMYVCNLLLPTDLFTKVVVLIYVCTIGRSKRFFLGGLLISKDCGCNTHYNLNLSLFLTLQNILDFFCKMVGRAEQEWLREPVGRRAIDRNKISAPPSCILLKHGYGENYTVSIAREKCFTYM